MHTSRRGAVSHKTETVIGTALRSSKLALLKVGLKWVNEGQHQCLSTWEIWEKTNFFVG